MTTSKRFNNNTSSNVMFSLRKISHIDRMYYKMIHTGSIIQFHKSEVEIHFRIERIVRRVWSMQYPFIFLFHLLQTRISCDVINEICRVRREWNEGSVIVLCMVK
jgi:hypothetical protein